VTSTAPHPSQSPAGVPSVDPIDIILLSYNRVDYLSEMVDSLERNTAWPYRLTVVDNVSGPDTRNWLRANRARFHQVIFNESNEHLAGYQHGIARTDSELFVVSDADILPHPPTADGCWLTRLIALADRHPDFGLISARLDSITEARDIHAGRKRLVDDELIETSTGVWLNLIRRDALRIPYMSDGITSYAIRRSGFRVGVAAEVLATHLGDQDPLRHPDYLARKQSASGLGTVYPEYPELVQAPRPPTLAELMLAAPVLAALRAYAIDPSETVELSRSSWPPLAAAEPQIESCVSGLERASARWTYDGTPPLARGGAAAVAIACLGDLDSALIEDALEVAREWVVVLAAGRAPVQTDGWTIVEERPGPAEAIERLTRTAGSRRWRQWLGYSTLEHRQHWLGALEAACFDGPCRLRVYVLRRDEPLPPAPERWRDGFGMRPAEPDWSPPVRRARIGPLLTKASRLVRAEWYLGRPQRKQSTQAGGGGLQEPTARP
jgi:hypothetical protein